MKINKILSLLVAISMLFSVGITAMAEEAVAKIGDTTYATLRDAVADVKEGETIALITNIVGDGISIEISKDITLDLGGYTFTDAYIITRADVTIKNGSIKNTKESYPIKVTGKTLTVEDITLEASKSDRAIWVDGGTLNFKNSSILATKGENNTKSNIYGIWVSEGTTANIYSGSITVDAGPNATAVAIYGNYANTVNVYGGKISTSGKYYSYAIWTHGDITVTGGEIVTNEKKYGYSSGITYGYNYAIYTNGNVTISGGTITTNGFRGYLVNAAGTDKKITVSGVEFTNVLTEIDKEKGGHKAPDLIKTETGNVVEISGGQFNGVANIKADYVVNGATIIVDDKIYTKTENVLTESVAVAKIGETSYATLQDAVNDAVDGDEVMINVAGDYSLSGISGKDITVTGNVDGVKFANIGAFNMGGANVTFNNVTFEYTNEIYKGLQHSGNLAYNNCTINGQVFLYGESETFNNCTFNQTSSDAYNVWTYGAKKVEFNGCTFNSAGKSVLIYSEDTNLFNDVTVTDCDFKASTAVDGKAAIEMDSSLIAGIYLTIDDKTTATGFGTGNVSGNSLWNNKKGANTEVKVDNEILWPVPTYVAQALDADGKVVGSYSDFESAIAAATADAEITRIEILSDYEQTTVANTDDYNNINKALTIGAPEGENYTITINVTGDSIALRVKDGGSLTIEENVTIEGLDVVANGFATTGENMTINGTLKALSLKQWTNNGAITINKTGSVWLGYGDGQFDLAYGNGTVTVNGNGDKTTAQFKAGYSGTRGNGNTLNLNNTYFEAGAWFKVNGSNGTINVDNSVLAVSGGDDPGALTMSSTGNAINLTNGSELQVGNLNIGENNSVILGTGCSIEATTISGTGKIVIDATNMTDGTTATISGNASGFTGTIEVINNDNLSAVIDENGNIVLIEVAKTNVAEVNGVGYETLQEALDAATAGTGNVTVNILADIDLTDVDWNPVTVSGPGYPVVTVNGNNKTITGLNDMLFAGTWAGKSGLIINDLTIKDSNIVNDKDDAKRTVGVGAFVGYPQASATITLNNCHLVNSKVEGGHWTGGLIGMAGGYNGTDGPVFMNLTIIGCSVTDSNITGKGSAGGIIGHGSCAAWTNVVIENTTVSGNTITSTGTDTNKAGAVMGTIGAAGQSTTVNGETKIGGASVSATVSGNTVTSGGTTITTIYGRQGSNTGMLYVTGGTYDNYPIEENVGYAQPKEDYEIVQNDDNTYGVVEKEAVKLFKFDSRDATLGNSLAMNFYIKNSDLDGTDYYAEVKHATADGIETTNIPYSDWIDDVDTDRKYVPYTGIAARQMADEISITIYNGNGKQVSTTHTDSLRKYALAYLAAYGSTASDWVTAFVDMLNYGAAAQKYFKYNVNDLATVGAEAYQKYASKDVTLSKDATVSGSGYSTALILMNTIQFSAYFTDVTSDMYAKVSYTDHYKNPHEYRIDYSDFVKNEETGRHEVIVDKLVVADAEQLVTVTMHKVDGTECGRISESINGYLYRVQKAYPDEELFPALAKFVASAKKSLH